MPPSWLETAYPRSSILRAVKRAKLSYSNEAVKKKNEHMQCHGKTSHIQLCIHLCDHVNNV